MKTVKIDDAEQNFVLPLKDGLPRLAFAIVEDFDSPSTWYLPHHTKRIKRVLLAGGNPQCTVDWKLMGKAIVDLYRQGIDIGCLVSDDRLLAEGASHLAAHYRIAGRRVPSVLGYLVSRFSHNGSQETIN
ncbi:MAG: hypothetical protein PHO26_04115 [Dehalococcoidia bacterium]|nr:hypothetical protein [Dehalococcoidia bacterium]MDD5493192.1 hypothetical protein [Dehalococcoidia bacterium]